MASGPIYIASDAHLGASSPAMASAFLEWLEHAAGRAELIFLNGDLFDFWFEWGSVVPSGHARVLGALARIVDEGTPIHLMGGNHDWWGGRHLTDEIGLVFHREPVRMELAGRRALIAHGDGLGGGDLGYRLLKGVLRSGLTRTAFRWIHPDVATAIARAVSRTDGDADHDGSAHAARAKSLERWARDRLLEDDTLDLVLLGHCHVPARVEVAPDRYYLNAGDWLNHGTYILLSPGDAPVLEHWKGSGAGSRP